MPKWYEDPTYLACAAAGAGLLWYWNKTDPDGGIRDLFEQGKQINFGTYNPILGIIQEAPETLRAAASKRMGWNIPQEVHSAAYMIRSEGAKQGALRVHVALNDLKSFRYADTLHELLTFSNDPKRRGWFGAQDSPPVPPDYPNRNARRYATSKNPYEGDVWTAKAAIEQHTYGIDPSQGATKFVDVPSLRPGKDKTIEELTALWKPEGLIPYTLPEYGPDLVLFRKA